jgi:hypothetical protein
MTVGTRLGFRLILASPSHPRQEMTVHGRITTTSQIFDARRMEEALVELEGLVNSQLPHLRLHISQDPT